LGRPSAAQEREIVIAREAKQSKIRAGHEVDCFASLAMTALEQRARL
jgi:hypothetical protein